MLPSLVIRGGASMAGFVQGVDREQVTLLPARLDAVKILRREIVF